MVYDTKNRMKSTLNVLGDCRVLNYEFVGSTPLNALRENIEQLQQISSFIRIMQKLRDEVELYRDHAKINISEPV